ncbi:Trafficking protein particle complex II-specific subunit 130 homolog [Linum perenne]
MCFCARLIGGGHHFLLAMFLKFLMVAQVSLMGPDGPLKSPQQQKGSGASMSRTFSSPGFEGSPDRPMRIAEIHVAAQHALQEIISDTELLKTLSSVEDFEQKYLELTKGAADNYHRSWWRRHAVVLDGEIAAVCFRHGNFDQAAKSYEKVCALYAGEGWQELLADVLPNLAECQKMLNDQAGYLSSSIRLLSLDKNLFLNKEREAFQAELVRLAHSELKDPVPLDVSSLITFSGNPGPPLELCDGDPGTLSVKVWSGFPDDITLDALSLTLMATFNADEGAKAVRSSTTVLKPGRNTTTLSLLPPKPGFYVLGVLTGQIGQLRFRSHSFSKGGPADSDDFMSYEKPNRPILKQLDQLSLEDGKMKFPDWASDIDSIIWVPICAESDGLPRGSSSVAPQKPNMVDGMRTIALKLEFGASHNQIFERTIAVHFSDPFHVSSRVIDKCNEGTLLLQVILQSQVKATLIVHDAWLELQDGFVHAGRGDGRPTLVSFPLAISPTSKGGIIFNISLGKTTGKDEDGGEKPESILNIRYGISGDRTCGAHAPVTMESVISDATKKDLTFRSVLVLQRPVVDPCMAVGFLPLPSAELRVGQLVTMKWRVEMLKDLEDKEVSEHNGEVLYEVNATPENWMIAGRKRGYVSLSRKQGSRIVISVLCIPLVAGYIRPPQLRLPDVKESNISCNPPGPHLVCIMPPALSSSFCIPV